MSTDRLNMLNVAKESKGDCSLCRREPCSDALGYEGTCKSP